MIESNDDLEHIFEQSVKEAEKRKHEYVTIEHLFLSLIKDEGIGAILLEFKVNVASLIKELEGYLDNEVKDIVVKDLTKPVVPRKTASLERLMNRAFTQALFQGRQDLTPMDILLSIFAEKRSYSNFLLKKFNVNKDDITDMVSAETIIDDSGFAGPGMEQKLRPDQADKILKHYTENLNQKYFDKKKR